MQEQRLPLRADGDETLLTVRVTPKSSRDAVETVESDASGQLYLKVRVRALPDKGAANKSVCQLIAKWLGIPKSRVALHAGDTGRVKQIRIALPVGDVSRFLQVKNTRRNHDSGVDRGACKL